MSITEGTKGWFTPNNGGTRARAEVVKVWGPECVNVRLADGTVQSSVLLKREGCAGHYFEPDQVDAVEAEIQAKGLTAPRVTPADIEASIASEHYAIASDMFGVGEHVAHPGGEPYPSALKVLTFCILVLRNGFTVTGESACASPENFDAELGRKIARAAAVNKLWPLLGYALKDRLAGPTNEQVNRFLTWPVPASVYPDGEPGKPGRTGTNLLSATEARDMLKHVLGA